MFLCFKHRYYNIVPTSRRFGSRYASQTLGIELRATLRKEFKNLPSPGPGSRRHSGSRRSYKRVGGGGSVICSKRFGRIFKSHLQRTVAVQRDVISRIRIRRKFPGATRNARNQRIPRSLFLLQRPVVRLSVKYRLNSVFPRYRYAHGLRADKRAVCFIIISLRYVANNSRWKRGILGFTKMF